MTVTTLPTKTTYEVGETFDATGMVVEAKYNDLSTEVITDYTIDKTGPLTNEDKKVTISYGGCTVDVAIKVGKDYAAKITETGTILVEAEDLDLSNLILRSDMEAVGKTNYIIDNDKAHGGKSIERYDRGSKINLNISVGEVASTKFSIFAASSGGEQMDSVVTVKLDDTAVASDNNPTLSSADDNQYYNWTEATYSFDSLAKGDHVITIEFTNGHPNLDYVSFYTSTYNGSSLIKTAESINIKTAPTKVDYIVGETFDSTGMVVELVYNNGDKEDITGYTIDKTGALTVDDTTVTVTYQGFTATVAIKVKAIDFTVSAAGTLLKEAEDADLSNLVGDSTGVQVKSGKSGASGSKCLSHVTGGYIEYVFSTDKEYALSVAVAMAKTSEITVSEKLAITLDGASVSVGDDKFSTSDNYVFADVNVDCGRIAAGNHRIRFTVGSINLDCFKFTFAE